MSGHWHGIGGAALAAMLWVSPVDAHAESPQTVESLWAEEGKVLRDLVPASRGGDRGEVLFRLGQWERDTAERLRRAENVPEEQLKSHLNAAEVAFQSAIPLAIEERLPQVLFSLGDIRRLRGNPTGAFAPFARLVHDYPGHPLAVDAAIALGDDAFDAAKLAEAVHRFEFADEHSVTESTKAYARYKLAWCHLNLEEMDVARGLFLDVIRLATSDGQKLSLADEARRDFVLALARDAQVSAADAREAIEKLALPEDRTRRYLEGYARVIAGAGRDEEAAGLFASLEGHAPAADAIRILTARLEIAVRQRRLDRTLEAGRKLGDALAAFPSTDEGAQHEAEKALRTAAVTLHGEGRARGDKATLQAALGLYIAYFSAFDAMPQAYDLHHHAGELLDALHQPAQAERHYTAAVLRDLKAIRGKKAPGKWLAASALGAVNMAQDAMPALEKPPRLAPPSEADHAPAPEATPLSEPEQTFIAACDRYIEALASDPHSVDIAYQRALLLYRHNEFEVAGKEMERIARDYPGQPKAEFAAELALDALQVQGRYDELAALAIRLGEKQELQAALGEELDDVHQAALLAAAHRVSKEGRHREAGDRYLKFVKAFPRSSRLELALFNASAELTMQGRLTEAVSVRTRLMQEHAASELAKRAREQQLRDLVNLGRFPEAAPIAAHLAGDPKSDEAATRLHDAITVAEAAGDVRGADALRQKYLKEFRKGPDAMSCAIALVDRARGCTVQMKSAREALSLAPDVGWRAIALERLARVENRCHEEGAARAHAAAAAGLVSRVPADRPDALDAIASAQLLLVESEAKRYRELPVAPPFERTLPRKLTALKALDDRLAAVISHGRAGPAVCALVQAGTAYGELASTLTAAQPPRSFTAEQRELFKEQLADKAQPLIDHAREALVQAITRAREARTDPMCLGQARKQLVALWPERFGPQQEAVAQLGTVGEETADPTVILQRAPDAPAAWLMAARARLHAQPHAAFVLADRVKPDDFLFPQALEVKAQALDAMGRVEEALSLWSLLAEEHRSRPLAHRILADRAMAARDFDGARTQLLALRETEEKNADIALNLGVTLHALGDLEGAERELREAASIDPKRLEAALDLGLLLCGDAARPQEGVRMLEQFHQAGGRAPDARGFESTLSACRALAERGRP